MPKKKIVKAKDERESLEYKWKLEEAYNEDHIYIEMKILEVLKAKELIPNKPEYGLEPDFLNLQDWEITLNKEIVLGNQEASVDSTTIKSVKGNLFITKHGFSLRPSFGFEFNSEFDEIKVHAAKIKQIISKQQEAQDWLVIQEQVEKRQIFNRTLNRKKEAFKQEAIDVLTGKQLGFSENAANTMVLAAMDHKDFREDMGLEQFIGLTFRLT